jgi:molybdenum cofactor cytidylyltransferase
MNRSPSLCGVVLAAGESSRMGRDKALLPWPPVVQPGKSSHAQTFLGAQIERLHQRADLVVVVGGKNAESIRPVVYATGGFLVVNPAPERGQFSSLQMGVQEVLNHGRDAAIITLVDRPPVVPETLNLLHAAFLEGLPQGFWAVVPEHDGRHGHPVFVGREMISAFLAAPPAATAREVEHTHEQRIRYVAVSDPLVTANIDSPADYAQLQTQRA